MRVPADAAPTARFSSRVADYVRYRPGYPAALFDHLAASGALHPGAVVADVGAGTGILTAALRGRCQHIHAVEPNGAMRAAAPDHEDTTVWPGRAEQTGLPDRSVDLICAAQAFHWFEPAAARAEFRRILRPGGLVALIWNTRLTSTPFLRGYEALLHRWGTDYAAVNHRGDRTADDIRAFFAPDIPAHHTFPNAQYFDLAGLQGRVRSSSYTPPPEHPDHAPMMDALAALFAEHEVDGLITFAYKTELYAATLS